MRKRKNGYYQLIPEKLIEKLAEIQQNPPKIIGFRISYMKQIIHLICLKKRNDGFSHLKMSYLKELIPNAERYIRYLLDENIIERDFYQPGNKSYGYKFTPMYESKFRSFPLADAKLLLRIERNSQKRTRSGYSYQYRYIQDISIDPEASNFAEKFYKDPESLNYAIASIQAIQNNDKFCTIDDTSFRCHSNLTTMPKELRRFVAIYGQHLIYNIDIKNSQPFFSTLLLTNPKKVAHMAKGRDLRMKLKTLQVEHYEDVERYINLVCEGRFYEYLVEEFKERGLYYTRDRMKKQVMIILFACNSYMSRPRKIFAELFPTVHSVFSQLRGNSKGDHFTSFKRFSILLQTVESHVVLKVILKRLNKEYPDVIALTVHDSILCTSDPEKVYDVMMDELTKFVGRPPILKLEKLKNCAIDDENPKQGRIRKDRRKERERTEQRRYNEAQTFVLS
jgi:hypothetical protein